MFAKDSKMVFDGSLFNTQHYKVWIKDKVNLVGWLVGFYDILTFVGYFTPNPFLYKYQFYFKQFSLGWVNSLIVKKKKNLFQAIQLIKLF